MVDEPTRDSPSLRNERAAAKKSKKDKDPLMSTSNSSSRSLTKNDSSKSSDTGEDRDEFGIRFVVQMS